MAKSGRPLLVLAALGILLGTAIGLGAVSPAGGADKSASARKVEIYATYYGWYDNTPPGCATAYKPYCAGGAGSYKHPITFASYAKEFPVGTRLYYPAVEKYFVMGDQCQECQADWIGKGPDGGPRLHHVDLWIGGKGGNEFAALNCEDALTESQPDGAPLLTPFIEHPPPGLPVSTEKLFDAKTGHCFGGARASSTTGRYENELASTCLAEAATKPGTPATLAPCSSAASEKLTYEGAFFVDRHLCLNLENKAYGSRLDWTHCSGGPRQQWETTSGGSIAWVQYLRCIGVRGKTVVLAHCGSSRAVHWRLTTE